MQAVSDTAAMDRALTLAAGARLVAAPNPWVGCVLVRDGAVVGEGETHAPGGSHAEAAALAAAGERAAGATAYVTLEPCAHQGRTPPCADALVRAGVARVVVAVRDPDERVAGRGVAALRAAGIEVVTGVREAEATAQLAPYLHHRTTGRSYVVVKAAMSVDGRMAATDGTSQWITGAAARADAHLLRAQSQAIVAGSGTVLADDPRLTARDVAGLPPSWRPPLRVVLDGRGRVPARGPLADGGQAPTLIITTAGAPRPFVKAWLAAGADVEEVPAGPRGVDLAAAFTVLGGRGVLQALVEGGATIAGACMAGGFADRLVTYIGGVALGDRAAPLFAGFHPPTLDAAPRLRLRGVTALGDNDARLDWLVAPPAVGEVG